MSTYKIAALTRQLARPGRAKVVYCHHYILWYYHPDARIASDRYGGYLHVADAWLWRVRQEDYA